MRNGQILAVAQLEAVLRKLIVGRQVVGQSERNGVFNVRARDSIAAPAGDQCAGLRGAAFETDCHCHIDARSYLPNARSCATTHLL